MARTRKTDGDGPRRLLPIDYSGHEPSLAFRGVPCDDQADPIVPAALETVDYRRPYEGADEAQPFGSTLRG